MSYHYFLQSHRQKRRLARTGPSPDCKPGTRRRSTMNSMKTHALILVTAAIAAAMGLGSCANPAILKISTPEVRAQILGDVEKDLLAGGGALLISGGSTSAAVAAMTAQEVKNIPELQKVMLQDAAAKNPQATAVVP